MERGHIIFGVLFLVLPLLLAGGVMLSPGGGAAFGLTLALIAVLAIGFAWAIAFVDVE